MLIWETLPRDHHWLIGCTAKAAEGAAMAAQ